MPAFLDLRDYVFGRLTVIEQSEHLSGRTAWLCKCQCGKTVVAKSTDLRTGGKRSCGCLADENRATARLKHGMTHTSLFNIWVGMRQRCNNPKSKAFKHYGGRGIKVCERWNTFKNFMADMGPRPGNMELERKNNDAGYSPENCIWADTRTQQRNKRDLHYITFNGQTKILTDWALDFGIARQTLYNRLKRGWPMEQALTNPLQAVKGEK